MENTFALVFSCEITGGAAGTIGIGLTTSGNGCMAYANNVHDNLGVGIFLSQGNSATHNLITNNTGASSDGIQTSNIQSLITFNTIYGNGRDGIRNTSAFGGNTTVVNGNILSSNGGYGLNFGSAAGWAAESLWDGNAYWNNTSGARNNANDLGTTNPIDGVAPYVNTLDVILTADPFVAKASNDYRLNTEVGGGAACRGFGVPTSWPGNTLTTSAPDMGAVQHADPTPPVGAPVIIGMGVTRPNFY